MNLVGKVDGRTASQELNRFPSGELPLELAGRPVGKLVYEKEGNLFRFTLFDQSGQEIETFKVEIIRRTDLASMHLFVRLLPCEFINSYTGNQTSDWVVSTLNPDELKALSS